MKKITLIITTLLLIVGLGLTQDLTVTKQFKRDQTLYEDFSGDPSMSATQDTVDYILNLNKPYPNQYYAYFQLDSTSGTPGIKIELLGKVFDHQDYTSITSTTWAGSTSDTSFTISSINRQSYALTFTGTDTIASTDSMFISANILMDTTKLAPNTGGAGAADSVGFYEGTFIDTALIDRTTYGASTMTGTMTYTDIVHYYRFYKIRVTRSAGVAVLDESDFKIWKREL